MIWLERHDDGANMHRFYAVEITRDLFGAWLLMRRWGRVGRGAGQSLIASYSDRAAAERARRELVAAKRRRGYV